MSFLTNIFIGGHNQPNIVCFLTAYHDLNTEDGTVRCTASATRCSAAMNQYATPGFPILIPALLAATVGVRQPREAGTVAGLTNPPS